MQKRRLFKGEEIKIGFNEKASQRLFLMHIREALRENKRLNYNRLYRHRKRRFDYDGSQTSFNINEIDRFMTENQVYEKHGWSGKQLSK